jgi:NitT/TauT family transport system substrate-binding protein
MKHLQANQASPINARRRHVLQMGAAGAALGLLGAPGVLRAQTGPKIRIGYWPIAAGLPFYSAIELGYFKEAGLDVEPLKFAGAQQVMEAVLSGRADGTANGTGSANIAIGEIAQPGTFKIFCSNPSNVKNVLDEVIVPVASPAKVMADLKGKRIASGPGIQNVTLAKTVLERGGAVGATVVELPIGQHVAALAAGQIDGAYTLEPTGTIGRMNGTTRVLEAGVIAHYVLGDPNAPWFGGSASLSSDFIKKHPDAAKKFVAAYGKGVAYRAHQGRRRAPVPQGLHRHRGSAHRRGAAGRVHHVQRVHPGRRGALPEVLRPVQREGHLRLAPDGRLHALQGLRP